jgi:hypothetical protein
MAAEAKESRQERTGLRLRLTSPYVVFKSTLLPQLQDCLPCARKMWVFESAISPHVAVISRPSKLSRCARLKPGRTGGGTQGLHHFGDVPVSTGALGRSVHAELSHLAI